MTNFERTGRFNDYQINLNKNRYYDKNMLQSPQFPLQSSSYYQSNNQNANQLVDFGSYHKKYKPRQSQSLNKSYNSNSSNPYQLMIDQQKLYTDEMIFLINDEQKNLQYFKQKIQNQKQKVSKDFNTFKIQIQHLIQDLKLSFEAELDSIYKDFIEKYGVFKNDIKVVRQMNRVQGLSKQPEKQYLKSYNNNNSRINTSNQNLLLQIQRDEQIYRNYHAAKHISRQYNQKIQAVKKKSQELVVLGGIQNQYYQQNKTYELLDSIKDQLHSKLTTIYPVMKDSYVLSSQRIIQIYRQNETQSKLVLRDLNEDKRCYDDDQGMNDGNFNNFNPTEYDNNTLKLETNQMSRMKSSTNDRPISSEYMNRVQSTASNYMNIPTNEKNSFSRMHSNHHMNSNPKQNSKFKISPEQVNLCTSWVQDITLQQDSTIQAYEHKDAILCCIFVKNQYIVSGGKDKLIYVYQLDTGKLIHTLAGHKASICSLGYHNGVFSSGGDHGCSTLILWDYNSWIIRNKIQIHQAALTCIIDLADQEHLATGSYDKRIIIYNYRKSSVVYTLEDNKSAIACMVLNNDGKNIVTSGLDSSIIIWKIHRKKDTIQCLYKDKQINVNNLVCTLRSLLLKPNYIIAGTKDGKIHLINIHNGQIIKKIQVAQGSVVQITVFQRESKPEWPLLISCIPKQKALIMTKTQTGRNSFLDVRGRLNVDYGCGIGPKVVINNQGMMAILSQSPYYKEIMMYTPRLF